MSTDVEGRFRPNDSLDSTLRSAMAAEGCGLFERLIVSLRVRRLSSDGRAELERQLTEKLLKDVPQLPAGAEVVGGILVGGWQDFFQWFIDNLPAILEMILSIIAMFG